MYKYFDQILFKNQCDFHKGYHTQHCQLVMIEKWKEVLDKGFLGCALLTDLSKVFDCIKHDLLTAKLAAYGCDSHLFSFIFSYLNETKQIIKINISNNSYTHKSSRGHQRSILGLLFNINICGMFLIHPTHMTQIYALS